ncbi:MAG: DUF1295 domain-containing protein [Anaerolineae bacterium]
MLYILLGVIGFLVAYLFDFVSLRQIPFGKQAVGLVSFALLGYAHVMVCFQGEKLAWPAALSYLGWPLFLLGTLAMVYSLYVEIPFKKTYVAEGVGDQLVTTGTYALARHPGVLWYGVVVIGLILVSGRWLMLYAAPIWFLMDVLYVWIQEKFFFKQMFPGYEQYQRETPMLIPTRRSIGCCLKTWRR